MTISTTPTASPHTVHTQSAPIPRPTPAEFDTILANGAAMRLTQYGILDVTGNDAATFLHSQLTNDITHLDDTHARLAGYCSPKGRLLASLYLWRTGPTLRLLVPKDTQAAVHKRLSMFVLRAQVKFVDASATLAMIGLAGNVQPALAGLFHPLPEAIHAKVDGPAGTLIRMPDAAACARYLWIGSHELIATQLVAHANTLPQVSAAVWDWLEIRSGVPRITEATVERFVPQMVNFDLIDGVSFRKGCYPGQEIVARSQYRGTIKRRMSIAHIANDASVICAGNELFHTSDPDQPCGMIVNAAAAPQGGSDALVEIKLAALANGSVHLLSINGPALTFLPLPYALAET